VNSTDTVTAAELGAAATIEAWRARGAHQLDPVRFRFIESLARRAAEHGGEIRRILEDKLAKLMAAYGEDLDQAGHAVPEASPGSASVASPAATLRPSLPGPSSASRVATPTATDAPSGPGTLGDLVAHLARQAPSPEQGTAARPASPTLSLGPELKSIRYFKRTLSKLSADQRLAQSLAKLPGNAGPLNSHHLVHRSLLLMRELSPDYLQRFIGHVDALLWLDQVGSGQSSTAKEMARTENDRKPARSKSG
jgi:hypothetical protein